MKILILFDTMIACCLGLTAMNCAATTLYVNLNCPSPTPPYTNWSTAATNIQDAVDVAVAGDAVLVTNGVYSTGGRGWFGSSTNRVTLTNAITLQSVNGPAVTLIVGSQVAGTGPVLTNAVRCVAMGPNAVLSGFTLTNGQAGWGNYPNGGGVSQVQSISPAGTVTNCVLIGNLSTNGAGGGAYRVKLINCQITGNCATYGGGACSCTLVNCSVVSNTASSGGGMYGSLTYGASLLSNCTIVGNSAASGGGAFDCTLTNSTLAGNFATNTGGGANGGSLNYCNVISNSATSGGGLSFGDAYNCSIIGNSASNYGGGLWGHSRTYANCTFAGNSAGKAGGGVYEGTFNNCILYFNTVSNQTSNYEPWGQTYSYNFCCTTPLPTNGVGSVTNEPIFANVAGGDLHLQSISPCINAGKIFLPLPLSDLDGNPRIVGGTIDIGAYEFQSPGSVLSYAWAQQYGLPTDGSADFADTDGDQMNNWKEWKSDTVPTNSLSYLGLVGVSNSPSGLNVSWQSVNTRSYFLERATNLADVPPFLPRASNIVGQSNVTTFTDTTATNEGPYFYRVGVQP